MHVDKPVSPSGLHVSCHLLEALCRGLGGRALILVWVQLKRKLAVCANTDVLALCMMCRATPVKRRMWHGHSQAVFNSWAVAVRGTPNTYIRPGDG